MEIKSTQGATQSSSSAANEFVKGVGWGFVAFVHVAVIMVVIYKIKLNCLPLQIVEWLACAPAGSAKCATACDPSNDTLFYLLAGITASDAIVLPVTFGFIWAARARKRRPNF